MSEIALRSVRDADVAGKRVLLRVDFNVPLQGGVIVDDTRIKAALPTIQLLLERGARAIIVLTHVGRPQGRVDETLQVAPLLSRLREYVQSGALDMLENLRFDPREEAGDESLAKELAARGDMYVNDAFSNSHRAHASMVALAKLLPSYAGLGLMNEVAHLNRALMPPPRSLAIIGGAKFETKEPLLQNLLAVYPQVLLGGALANDLLKARGLPVGVSLVSAQPVPEALAGEERLIAPDDLVVAPEAAPTQTEREAHTADVRIDERIVDLGTKTAKEWAEKIAQSDFVLWNGPMGVYEKGYVEGTDALAKALINSSCTAVLGGGDTAAALAQFTFDPHRIFVSTGGGAMLEFLANGGSLPALDVLRT